MGIVKPKLKKKKVPYKRIGLAIVPPAAFTVVPGYTLPRTNGMPKTKGVNRFAASSTAIVASIALPSVVNELDDDEEDSWSFNSLPNEDGDKYNKKTNITKVITPSAAIENNDDDDDDRKESISVDLPPAFDDYMYNKYIEPGSNCESNVICSLSRVISSPSRETCSPSRPIYSPSRITCPPSRATCPSNLIISKPSPSFVDYIHTPGSKCESRMISSPSRPVFSPNNREICPPSRMTFSPSRITCPPDLIISKSCSHPKLESIEGDPPPSFGEYMYNRRSYDPCSSRIINPYSSRVINPYPSRVINPYPSRVINPCPSRVINPCPSRVIEPYPSRIIEPCPSRIIEPCPSIMVSDRFSVKEYEDSTEKEPCGKKGWRQKINKAIKKRMIGKEIDVNNRNLPSQYEITCTPSLENYLTTETYNPIELRKISEDLANNVISTLKQDNNEAYCSKPLQALLWEVTTEIERSLAKISKYHDNERKLASRRPSESTSESRKRKLYDILRRLPSRMSGTKKKESTTDSYYMKPSIRLSDKDGRKNSNSEYSVKKQISKAVMNNDINCNKRIDRKLESQQDLKYSIKCTESLQDFLMSEAVDDRNKMRLVSDMLTHAVLAELKQQNTKTRSSKSSEILFREVSKQVDRSLDDLVKQINKDKSRRKKSSKRETEHSDRRKSPKSKQSEQQPIREEVLKPSKREETKSQNPSKREETKSQKPSPSKQKVDVKPTHRSPRQREQDSMDDELNENAATVLMHHRDDKKSVTRAISSMKIPPPTPTLLKNKISEISYQNSETNNDELMIEMVTISTQMKASDDDEICLVNMSNKDVDEGIEICIPKTKTPTPIKTPIKTPTKTPTPIKTPTPTPTPIKTPTPMKTSSVNETQDEMSSNLYKSYNIVKEDFLPNSDQVLYEGGSQTADFHVVSEEPNKMERKLSFDIDKITDEVIELLPPHILNDIIQSSRKRK